MWRSCSGRHIVALACAVLLVMATCAHAQEDEDELCLDGSEPQKVDEDNNHCPQYNGASCCAAMADFSRTTTCVEDGCLNYCHGYGVTNQCAFLNDILRCGATCKPGWDRYIGSNNEIRICAQFWDERASACKLFRYCAPNDEGIPQDCFDSSARCRRFYREASGVDNYEMSPPIRHTWNTGINVTDERGERVPTYVRVESVVDCFNQGGLHHPLQLALLCIMAMAFLAL